MTSVIHAAKMSMDQWINGSMDRRGRTTNTTKAVVLDPERGIEPEAKRGAQAVGPIDERAAAQHAMLTVFWAVRVGGVAFLKIVVPVPTPVSYTHLTLPTILLV